MTSIEGSLLSSESGAFCVHDRGCVWSCLVGGSEVGGMVFRVDFTCYRHNHTTYNNTYNKIYNTKRHDTTYHTSSCLKFNG